MRGLDDKVRQFRERALGESRCVWVDALYEKVRVDDRVESMAVVIAAGVNREGRREVLGFDAIPTEDRTKRESFPGIPAARVMVFIAKMRYSLVGVRNRGTGRTAPSAA